MKKEKKKSRKNAKKDVIAVALPADTSVAPAAAAETNGRGRKRAERRRVVNEDLQLELATLRQNVDEMLARYKLKLDAELLQLADATSGNGTLDGGTGRLPIATAEAMLKQIRELEIKAVKGRAKDFQRVQDLVGNLIEQLPAAK
jgi:hypothetical protein